MAIPFIDLKAQQRRLGSDIQARINAVLEHGQFIMGPEIGELETALSELAEVPHAITCSSGTDALLMPLLARGVGPGDAIFTTPFTFIATAEVISLLGATPVFVDIDPRTFNIDPAKLEEAIEGVKADSKLQPKGVITVDLFGLPADYAAIGELLEGEQLFVLEDAAQSFGASYRGRPAGSFGDVAATSFFPAKPLGCYGDGGAVFTSDAELAERLRSLRVHGKGTDKYDNVRIGLNARMDTLQAAILLSKLTVFADEIECRNRAAKRYDDSLSGLVETPFIPNECVSAWAQYTILVDQRDSIQASLKAAGVPTAIYYPTPLHLQTAYAYLGYRAGDFPVSEETSLRALSLPMHPYLDESTQDSICGALLAALGEASGRRSA